MAAFALLGQLRRSRRTSLMLFAGSLLALVIAAVWFVDARSSLAEAYQQLGNRNHSLAEARVQEQEAKLRVDYAQSSARLLDAARAHGLQPPGWGERLINLRQSQMSREDAIPLLASVARSHDRMFGADSFELSVTHPDEGLFDPPMATDRRPSPLSLSLRGSLLFQTASGGVLPHAGHPAGAP